MFEAECSEFCLQLYGPYRQCPGQNLKAELLMIERKIHDGHAHASSKLSWRLSRFSVIREPVMADVFIHCARR